jgi:hypothetical protein
VCRSEIGTAGDDIAALGLKVRCFAVREMAWRRSGLREVTKRARMGSVQEAASAGSNQNPPRIRLID